MISLAVYIAEIIAILSQLPCPGVAFRWVRSTTVNTTCGGNPGLLPNLNLGLPPNSSVFVSGYLPTNIGWICQTNSEFGATSYNDVHGLFWSYYNGTDHVEIGISAKDQQTQTNQWALYIYHSNQNNILHFRICKWLKGKYTPQDNPGLNFATGDGGSCLYRLQFNFTFQQNHVIGVTWSSDYVTFFGPSRVVRYRIENAWYRATVRCHSRETCAMYPVYNRTTLNVTTNAQGLIQSYSVCDTCSGFPIHVFALMEGGYIPNDFSFNNWFMLSNTSTYLQGRVVSSQPLKLLCLWPVPVLTANADPIHFNLTNAGSQCNGYSYNGLADALRFSLNFTEDQVLNGVHNLDFLSSEGNFSLTCTNDTSVSSRMMIPFGVTKEIYRCYVASTNTNGSYVTFVGVLPPVVREIVVSRYGTVYVNGVKMLVLPSLDSVIFNVTSDVGSDFWTVAFAQESEVMLELNTTNIVDILYCDTPINKLKCQQLSFSLEDGFYASSSVYTQVTPRSYVALPYHATHTQIDLYVDPRLYQADVILINGGNQTICVNTTQFTTSFNTTHYTNTFGAIENVDCPFTFYTLNDYLTFGTICFSLHPLAGSCVMSIDSVTLGYHQPIGTLYVSHTPGNTITGVQQKTGGVYDPSILYLDQCTDYTIYGTTGKGVITKLNTSIIAGLYYVSTSGQLLGFKNATTGDVFAVRPCDLSNQLAVYQDRIVGAMTATVNTTFGFGNTTELPNFYYHSNANESCEEPVLTYGQVGICADGGLVAVSAKQSQPNPVSPIASANISVPINFTISVQVEYLQMYMQPVSVDCNTYVCNGNVHCLRLLSQYASACRNIEAALQLSARLESLEVNSVVTVAEEAVPLANISHFDNYNMSVLLPRKDGRSVIEDILFNKVVTSGLGTVDQDYKDCIKNSGVQDVADVACAQYYNGIMVLPGVVDETKMGLYTAALTGSMVMGGLTAAAAIPFSLAVQSRLNYVALQTDVLQQNQQILADAFNSAMGNVTQAFTEVNDALQQTSSAINTVAQALGKVQTVVNEQGEALSQLTRQLASNFQAISASIEDIYKRLDGLAADAQVDRLITGRLGALNAFVTQTLTKYTETRASRQLAIQKINECVKAQSARFGFCGNGTHLFSIANAAPNGIMLFHTVLVPSAYATVEAWAGVCVDNTAALILRDVRTTLFVSGTDYFVTSRDMYQPRKPVLADFVQISTCSVSYLNITGSQLSQVIPDYLDVNKTLQDFQQQLPNYTLPDLGLDLYNNTILNLTTEIAVLQNKSDSLYESTVKLQRLIEQLNQTYVDLEWLNRVENYIKWPWYVWLAILLVLIVVSFLMLYCCIATGCCGCLSCLASSCCDCGGKRLQRYEVEKVHIQ
uniref:Spike glycoprotein n=1 Tax=Alphacoronavirus sp. TaxID=1906673 RepID=A0A8F1CXG4_9ALPC|nr:spike glycoprotein [Alphacoronavirus sp.]